MNQNQIHINPLLLAKEVKFTMSTSAGKGGQNVNRVATKATLHFLIEASDLLTQNQKTIVFDKLKNRINKEGYLVLVNQESRSAEKNKKTAINKLSELLILALTPKKVRKKIKVSKTLKQKRLADKKKIAEKKELRRKFSF